MVDGVPTGKGYDAIGTTIANSLGLGGFSPDSIHIAYRSSNGKKAFVIVDETRKEYDDGVGRIVWDSADRFHYLAWKGNSIYLVEESIEER